MKKIAYSIMIVAALASCKSKTTSTVSDTASADTATNKAEVSKTSPDAVANNTPIATGAFDINTIPVTDKDPGKFPYLGLPDKYTFNYQKEANAKDINK
jgi:hypothetical protein